MERTYNVKYAGRIHVVFGGSGTVEGMFVKNAMQAEPVDAGTKKRDSKGAFFVLLNGEHE